jgi:predicted LPLAT superfamily acyltransferase
MLQLTWAQMHLSSRTALRRLQRNVRLYGLTVNTSLLQSITSIFLIITLYD